VRLGCVEQVACLVEVVVAAVHPHLAPEEVAAGLGPEDPPAGLLQQPVEGGIAG
jgi:hypothetical protein